MPSLLEMGRLLLAVYEGGLAAVPMEEGGD